MNLALYCTVAQAAEIAGITDRQVRNALADGRMTGEKVGSVWMVLRASAEGFQRHPARGRPKRAKKARRKPPADR